MQLRRLRLDVSVSRSSPVLMCFALVACIYVLRTRCMHLCASRSSHAFMCCALVACIYVLRALRLYLCASHSSRARTFKVAEQKTKTE